MKNISSYRSLDLISNMEKCVTRNLSPLSRTDLEEVSTIEKPFEPS